MKAIVIAALLLSGCGYEIRQAQSSTPEKAGPVQATATPRNNSAELEETIRKLRQENVRLQQEAATAKDDYQKLIQAAIDEGETLLYDGGTMFSEPRLRWRIAGKLAPGIIGTANGAYFRHFNTQTHVGTDPRKPAQVQAP